MYQNYNYYPPQNQQVSQQFGQTQSYLRQAPPQGLRGRPVSSLEEARATSIDFDGSIFYFPDIANKCIYTKQINIDGTANLQMYELKEIPREVKMEQIPIDQFVTKDEFNKAMAEIRQSLINNQNTPVAVDKPQTEILAF